MRFQMNPKLLLLLNMVGTGLAFGAVALLYQVDTLIHSTLYGYGLQFSPEWAVPYWTFERLALGLMGGIAGVSILSAIYLVLSIRAPPLTRATPVRQRLEITQPQEEPQKRAQQQPAQKKRAPEREVDEDGVEIAALPLVCNKCGKVFTQPLCMFDFKSGKPRLVNVCPYCNAVLAVSGNSKGE
jgi:uncharacterized Zn-finger protein